jgi:hypothetical protein
VVWCVTGGSIGGSQFLVGSAYWGRSRPSLFVGWALSVVLSYGQGVLGGARFVLVGSAYWGGSRPSLVVDWVLLVFLSYGQGIRSVVEVDSGFEGTVLFCIESVVLGRPIEAGPRSACGLCGVLLWCWWCVCWCVCGVCFCFLCVFVLFCFPLDTP